MNIIKWWANANIWNKVRAVLGTFGPGTELFLIVKDANPNLQITLCILGGLGYAISIIMEDKDNNGVVDMFENKPKI